MRIHKISRVAFMVLAGAGGLAPVAAQNRPAELVTPPEITIQQTPAGPMFADTQGFTLYVTERDAEPGKSSCVEACIAEWPPVRASADAKPFGEWSLVPRTDGASQWAYRDRPLYRYRREGRPGWAEAQNDFWRYASVVSFPVRGGRGRGRGFVQIVAKTKISVPGVPGGIAGQMTPRGAVFTDAEGMTLYTPAPRANCSGRCLDTWKPLRAPAAAVAVGNWTIIAGEDGTPQWAYQGRAVFRSTKDFQIGDMSGEDGLWNAIRVPPEASQGSRTP